MKICIHSLSIIIILITVLSSCNTEHVYDKQEVLDSISVRLNKLSDYYDTNPFRPYDATDENLLNFFILDLTDTLNVVPVPNTNGFIDNHIYHIAALRASYAVSVILILNKGDLIFFEGLKCVDKIDCTEDVLNWIEEESGYDYSEDVIDRVRNYKKYNKNFGMCEIGSYPICEGVQKNLVINYTEQVMDTVVMYDFPKIKESIPNVFINMEYRFLLVNSSTFARSYCFSFNDLVYYLAINDKNEIIHIACLDSNFVTEEGVHIGMKLEDVEKRTHHKLEYNKGFGFTVLLQSGCKAFFHFEDANKGSLKEPAIVNYIFRE